MSRGLAQDYASRNKFLGKTFEKIRQIKFSTTVHSARNYFLNGMSPPRKVQS